MPIHSARSVALSVLVESAHSTEGLDTLFDRTLLRTPLDGRDRALALEITYGVCRRLLTIDWRLQPVLDKPLAGLPLAVQMLLRMGAYQVLFLDRIPASAAVNETVNLVKAQVKKLQRDWGGFVNAVLRALIREPIAQWPSVHDDAAYALSVRYSVPEWLSRRWLDRLGLAVAQTVCEQASLIPPLTLRVNLLRITREELLRRMEKAGIQGKPTRISPAGITLVEGGSVAMLPGFAEGHFYVEDEAAQLIPFLLDVRPGNLVLDACAAPGGKATHIAELMEDQGRIYAVDRSAGRLRAVQTNSSRLQLKSIVPIVGDLRDSSWEDAAAKMVKTPGRLWFDRILVDAPCSGLGVLRRHPESKWRKGQNAFARHQAVQSHILASAARCLRPGGVLVYSTCSTEPEENEVVIDGFLRSHAEFRRMSMAPWLPEPGRQFLTARGDFSTMGNVDSMDGFYAARLTRMDS
jgi:16S rRNA (cytosine967-C5)-methyltransferase